MLAKERKSKRTPLPDSVSQSGRFSAWLNEVMIDHSVTNSALSRALGGERTAASPRIRAWRQGTWKRPRPATCFRIGEALRVAGVSWSNGAVALVQADYLAEFVEVLISL